MILSIDEVKQFYRIWFPLLHFANQKLNVVPSFPDEWGEDSVNTEHAGFIRNALWEDESNSILDEFIQQNPSQLDAEDLAIVDQWKHRISDTFFLVRYLKKHTVFILEGSPSRAYGVFGLLSAFDEMFSHSLPIYAQTTLLPFKDKIIYDSLILPYSISFGGGIKSSLNDTYRGIQERGGIITQLSFEHNAVPDTKQLTKGNKKVLSAFKKRLKKLGVNPSKTVEHSDNIAQFANYLLNNSIPPISLIDINEQLLDTYIQQSSKNVNIVSMMLFANFLRDTYRLEYGDAEDILTSLKNQ